MRSATALASPAGIPAASARHNVLPSAMFSTAFFGVVSFAAYSSTGVRFAMRALVRWFVDLLTAERIPILPRWSIPGEICKCSPHSPLRAALAAVPKVPLVPKSRIRIGAGAGKSSGSAHKSPQNKESAQPGGACPRPSVCGRVVGVARPCSTTVSLVVW